MITKETVKKEFLKHFEEESAKEIMEILETTQIFDKKELSDEEVQEAITKALDSKFEEKFEEYTKTEKGSKVMKILSGQDIEELDKIKSKKERTKALHSFLVKGVDRMSEEEVKAISNPVYTKTMNSVDFSTGGIFATEDMIDEILKDYIEYSPVRQLFGMKTTTEKSISYTRRPESGVVKALHTAELEEMGDSGTLKYKKGNIPLHKITALVGMTREDIMYSKSQVDLEAEINTECTEQLAVTEADDVINGNGIDRAEGILQNNEIERIETAGATVSYKDVVQFMNSIKPIYRRNGICIANRAFIDILITLEDGNGRPIFFEAGGFPSIQSKIFDDGVRGQIVGYINGKPVFDFPDMPEDVTTTGTPLMAYGDFKRGYMIGDNPDMYMLRNEYSQARKSIIEFQFEKYCGGQTVLPEAIKILTLGS